MILQIVGFVFQLIFIAVPLAIGALLLFIAGVIIARAFFGGVPYGYSVNNLTIRWRTTLASALAFMLVIALLIVMLAFVNAMSRLTKQSGQPGNVIVLSDGAIDELFSNLQYTETGDVERQPSVLHDEDGRLLCSRETYLVAIQDTGTVQDNRPARRFVQVRAIEDPLMAARVHAINLYPGGKWFSEAGVEDIPGTKEQAIQAVLGEGIAREIGHDRGKDTLHVGDIFELGGRKWIAVGITKTEGSTFGSEVWAKWSLVARLFGKERYTSIVLSTAGPAQAKELADQLTTSFKKAALQGMPETEYFARLDDTSKQFLGAIIFVTAIMSIGGIFGVMNTMFAAVSARKKDIGVLRIVGFARWQVLAVFLLESLLIAIVGGILGCALATLTDGWTANSIVSGGQGAGKFVALKLAVTIDVLVAGMVVALLMGALGGFFPAISAMRQRPLESLR